MAKTVDVFGFDELKKAFERCEKRYPNQADALLMAQGQAVNKRTKALTPVRTKKLRNSWRLKKVKLYKGGKVRVVRIQSAADRHCVHCRGDKSHYCKVLCLLEKIQLFDNLL